MDLSLSGITRTIANNAVATVEAAEKIGAVVTGNNGTEKNSSSNAATVESFYVRKSHKNALALQAGQSGRGEHAYQKSMNQYYRPAYYYPWYYPTYSYPYHMPYYSYYPTVGVKKACPEQEVTDITLQFPYSTNMLLFILIALVALMFFKK